ncbi:MAG: thioredoxin family protein [Firmicutes bacterium]|nr:thioredoxin family protein [Bacillota bacterium]
MKDKKILICSIILLVVIGLTMTLSLIYNQKDEITEDGLRFKEEYEALNSSIPISIAENNPIKYASYDEVEKLFDNGTGIIYFGFPSCPWCRNMLPVLFDVAKQNNVDVIYYINPRELKKNNEEYNKLLGLLNPYLEELDGEKVLYVPDVYFIKKGEVVGHHLSTVESQTDPRVSLTENQRQELFDIYQNFLNKIK